MISDAIGVQVRFLMLRKPPLHFASQQLAPRILMLRLSGLRVGLDLLREDRFGIEASDSVVRFTRALAVCSQFPHGV
jgi:hypothetical protein